MIVDPKNISQYLPSINFKVEPKRLISYILEAQREITDRILGYDIEELLVENSDDNLSELKNLACRAISITAYLNAIPEMDLQLSEAGFVVASNEAFKPASKERIERLMESLRHRKSAALDNLLVFLVHNSKDDASPIKDWRGSRQFVYFSQTPVLTLAEFERFNLIDKSVDLSWDKFYSYIPIMKGNLYSTVAYYISGSYIRDVMERIRDNEPILDNERQVLSHIKAAIIAGAMEKRDVLIQESISARKIMVDNIDMFPIFYNSSSYHLPETSISGTGGVSNFLI